MIPDLHSAPHDCRSPGDCPQAQRQAQDEAIGYRPGKRWEGEDDVAHEKADGGGVGGGHAVGAFGLLLGAFAIIVGVFYHYDRPLLLDQAFADLGCGGQHKRSAV